MLRCFSARPRRSLIWLCVLAWSLTASAAAANKKPPERPVNLNTATAEELQQVPGIGPVTAEKILKMRKAYGPFKSVDDLRAIRGIGPKRLEKMRKYLTIGKPRIPQNSTKKPADATAPGTKPSALEKPVTSFEIPPNKARCLRS